MYNAGFPSAVEELKKKIREAAQQIFKRDVCQALCNLFDLLQIVFVQEGEQIEQYL